ncbi:uncharacterized protein LOC135081037 [Ostrinia nubilalis]|uniref:uncharacterized protein LOC135081037 n=1 Tax=Ostrinia nubilalis TaxID=29057 RepID=UPI00308226C0
MKARLGLREALVGKVLNTEYTGSELAAINQVKMVWEHSGYKAVLFMIAFIEARSAVLEIEAVLDQALALKFAMDQAKTQPHFPFSRVINPNAHPELTHKNYNHLYVAAIAYAKKMKSVGENFRTSEAIKSNQLSLINRYLEEDAKLSISEPSDAVLEKMRILGLGTRRRRRRDGDSSDEEDAEPRRRKRRH